MEKRIVIGQNRLVTKEIIQDFSFLFFFRVHSTDLVKKRDRRFRVRRDKCFKNEPPIFGRERVRLQFVRDFV